MVVPSPAYKRELLQYLSCFVRSNVQFDAVGRTGLSWLADRRAEGSGEHRLGQTVTPNHRQTTRQRAIDCGR
jgi:hypothetical protein